MIFKSKHSATKYYQTVIDNPKLWPRCEWCSQRIPYVPSKKSKKEWLEKTQFCSRICSNRHRARTAQSKTCACGTIFYRNPNTTSKNWGLRKQCQKCKAKSYREGGINSKDKPVKRGFYIFKHSRCEFIRVGGKINCIDPNLIEIRDKKINEVISRLKECGS